MIPRRDRRCFVKRPLLAYLVLLGWILAGIYLIVGCIFWRQLVERAERRGLPPASFLRQSKAPISIPSVVEFLENWISELHHDMETARRRHRRDFDYQTAWNVFHKATVQKLIPWDQDYLQRMPERRTDDSIFMSIVSFRDENCATTLLEAFRKAHAPRRLFVGLNQQNCYANCTSGYDKDKGGFQPTDPDSDCRNDFCVDPDLGSRYCSQVRILHVQESDSLGPVAARFFASKLYQGESWYLQMDAHMVFLQDWDRVALDMMHKAPADKPVLSHYPPGHKMNLAAQKPTGRLCGAVFHFQTIRFEELGKYDHEALDLPHFAPFIGAGFLMAHAGFLKEVPFDPMLPYIFMGEEIIMSSRLWTAGYDLFSPSQAVVGHIYVRKHKPKFWETVSRFLNVYDALEDLVHERIQYQLGYPESARDMQAIPTVLDHVELYGMGRERPLKDYMHSVGIDVYRKEFVDLEWCRQGTPPEHMQHLAHLYKNQTNPT